MSAYVSGGGSLLITGPLDRDEHWHLVSRAASTNLDAHAEALTYHNAVIKLSDRTISLSFDQQKRNAQSREAASECSPGRQPGGSHWETT